MSTSPRERIIVALDTDAAGARELARALAGSVRWLKVGMTLFYQAGPAIVTELREQGFDVFLDLKLHDIPHQVRGAAESVSRLGVQMLTVHASGGAPMVAAAVEGAAEGAAVAGLPSPAVIGVTVLTSMSDDVLHSVGINRVAAEQVPLLGGVVRDAGAAGCVCSPQEAHLMRELLGPDALVVTPGVRPAGADVGDQSRVATPAAAIASGASHLVIGRPITEASDPREAVERIVSEMEGPNA
ncbi:MAG TPA: orotidine-5'-phosphate decarboxylase [Coriobacteriia bacterium]|nr:orotidine-5'-phosphate decarboxylase [Coriobacteriia bacterium]